MKKAIFLFAFVLGMGTFSQAQVVSPDQVVELKAQKIAPSRGENPNIKSKKPTEDKVDEKVKTRGTTTCDLKLENWSSYCVDVYVDGYYKCTMSSKTYMYVVVDLGYSSIYGESCGATMEWSKKGIQCSDSYTYRFYD
ncbi:MAG: hypothetical protein GC180_10855 [Bacteroidetes bacterium]|nr:hypothetical protein [Bacteroidota bacterium]